MDICIMCWSFQVTRGADRFRFVKAARVIIPRHAEANVKEKDGYDPSK